MFGPGSRLRPPSRTSPTTPIIWRGRSSLKAGPTPRPMMMRSFRARRHRNVKWRFQCFGHSLLRSLLFKFSVSNARATEALSAGDFAEARQNRRCYKIPFHDPSGSPPLTFLVGENGTGKSTLLEAVSVALGFNAEGGSRNFNFSTRASHSDLHACLRLVRSYRRPRDGYFLRAESFFNVATEIERLDAEAAHDYPIIGRLRCAVFA